VVNLTEYLQAVVLCISVLIFIRNQVTNILALVLGLFFKIRGTSVQVINMLSNTGICMSFKTIECLKVIISDDTVQRAVALLVGGDPCFVVYDNINLYLQKSQQQVFNQN
jgi:hypothetical protein